MPGRPRGGKRASADYEATKLLLRKDVKRSLQHREIEGHGNLSEQANAALDFALSEEWLRLPVLGRVAAGDAILAQENIEEYITLPASVVRQASFALRVRGNSMSPTIDDGDLVLVRLQETAISGQIVVVRQDDEACCKRLISVNGTAELRSDNPDYPPVSLPRAVIVGRVVKVIKDL
jgi:repressor LexA